MDRRSVLLVEDDDDVRSALSTYLSVSGYDVLEAADGSEALAQLRDREVGLVLLDLWMPKMNGWEFRAEQLRSEELKDIPVVIITADQIAAQHAARLGAADYMKKPVDLPRLLELVHRYC